MCTGLKFVVRRDEVPSQMLKLLLRTELTIRVLERNEVAQPEDGEIPLIFGRKTLPHQFERVERSMFRNFGLSPKAWHKDHLVCIAVKDLDVPQRDDAPLLRIRDARFKKAANQIPSWFEQVPTQRAA